MSILVLILVFIAGMTLGFFLAAALSLGASAGEGMSHGEVPHRDIADMSRLS